ncbi:MAG TPA: LEA type 2 family protein [Steroidobacteraceae bacterium]
MSWMRRALWPLLATLLLGGCAALPNYDPPEVTVAGFESLPGEGMEVRLLVKLRVQNPNDRAIDYSGASVKLEVFDKTFATGVTDEAGSVPRFGEAVVAVPVTVSVLRMVRNVLGLIDGQPIETIPYEMSGKLNTGTFSALRFSSKGSFKVPSSAPAPTPDTIPDTT